MFQSTKTYGHNQGFSCTFRQHRAESHCRFLHGYALSIRLVFQATSLDKNGWVLDFGGFKPLKALLQERFDHKTLVAADDPNIEDFERLQELGLAQVIIVPGVGCEAFASQIFNMVRVWLNETDQDTRVDLVSVEVSEHEANSAIRLNPRFHKAPQ